MKKINAGVGKNGETLEPLYFVKRGSLVVRRRARTYKRQLMEDA